MKVLIVGLGSIGIRHGRNLMELGADVAVGFDPVEERREHFEEEIGGVGVSSLEEGLDRGSDLAVIASPSRFHLEQATVCAQAGCHLLIEKPLGISMEGVAELQELTERHGLFVCCAAMAVRSRPGTCRGVAEWVRFRRSLAGPAALRLRAAACRQRRVPARWTGRGRHSLAPRGQWLPAGVFLLM